MRASGLVGLLVAGLAGAASLAAAAEGVSLRGMSGPFGDVAREGAWGQRGIVVSNAGGEARRVKLAHVASRAAGGDVRFCRVLSVPAGCARSTRIPVQFGGVAAKRQGVGGGAGKTLLHREIYVLRDARTGQQIQQDFTLVRAILPTETAVAVIGRSAQMDDAYSYLGRLGGHYLGKVRLVSLPRAEDLPDRWYGYGAFAVVVVRKLDCMKLRASQVAALVNWARRGGVVVLAGSDALGEMLEGPLGAAAGVAATGLHYVDSLQPARAGAQPMPAVRLAQSVPMVSLAPVAAEVLWEAGGLPLLTRRRLGEGKVLCLAVPTGGLAGEPLQVVWKALGGELEAVGPISADAFARSAEKDGRPQPSPASVALQDIAGRRGPGRALPAGLLAGLAVLVLALGLVLKPRLRGEWIWAVLLPLTLAAAVAAVLLSRAQADPERSSFIGLVSATGPDTARVQVAHAYYSGPAARELTFSAGGPGGIIYPAVRDQVGFATPEVHFDGVMSLPDRAIGPNLVFTYNTDAILPLRGIEGAVSFDAAGLTGTLTNHLGMDVADAVVCVDRRAYPLGDLPAGRPVEVAAVPASRLGEGEFTGSLAAGLAEGRRNDLVAAIVNRPDVNRHVSREPVIIGYAEGAPLAGARDGLRRQGWSVVVWPLEIARPAAGTKVRIPSGFARVDFEHVRGRRMLNPFTGEFLRNNSGGEMRLLVRPPGGVRLRDAAVRLTLALSAPDFRLTVAGVPAGGGPHDELAVYDSPAGVLRVTVAGADRFTRPDGVCVLALKVKPLGGKVKKPAVEMMTLGWRFRKIDVVLEGVVR